MTLQTYLKRAEQLVADNSPAILTGLGVAGTITTAFLAGKATLRASDILRDYDRFKRYEEPERDVRKSVELVWHCYAQTFGMGVVTIAAIVAANRVGTRRAAAVAAAYSVTERAFDEYKEKVVEKLGENKERKVREEIAQDHVTNRPPTAQNIIVSGRGNHLILDDYTGRYFEGNVEDLRRAANDTNAEIIGNVYASLNEFYRKVGLPTIGAGDDVGWNTDKLMDLTFHGAMTDENLPCVVMTFSVVPVRGYDSVH